MGGDDLTVREAEGWSTKDLLWHIAHWWGDLARMLDEIRAGTFSEPPEDDQATDEENARVLEEGRGMSLAEVELGLADARDRMLAAWTSMPETSEAAERWFVWETIEHYEEHEADLRRFVEEARSSR
jgi:hypothetical protein